MLGAQGTQRGELGCRQLLLGVLYHTAIAVQAFRILLGPVGLDIEPFPLLKSLEVIRQRPLRRRRRVELLLQIVVLLPMAIALLLLLAQLGHDPLGCLLARTELLDAAL